MAFDLESLAEATGGAIGAVVSTSILYPLDTCKTKYQAEVRAHHQQKYRNVSGVLWEAISTGQVVSLYQGLGTKNLLSFISQFIYFFGYSFFKRLYLEKTGSKTIGTKANLILAAAAAASTVIITQYTAFDQLKQRLLKRQLKEKTNIKSSPQALSAISAFVLGAVSKCIAKSLTYPAIRCKVTIQAADSDDNDETKEAQFKNQKTVYGALYSIGKKEGLLGFYKGIQAQILKTVLSSALLLMIKEKISKATWMLMLALRRYLFMTQTRLKSA